MEFFAQRKMEDSAGEVQEELRATYYKAYSKRMESSKYDQLFCLQHMDYQVPPRYLSNIIELQMDIKSRAIEFGIRGNIHIDQGHSFCYSVTVLFPVAFQKQLFKSRFALYNTGVTGDDSLMFQKLTFLSMEKASKQAFIGAQKSRKQEENSKTGKTDLSRIMKEMSESTLRQ